MRCYNSTYLTQRNSVQPRTHAMTKFSIHEFMYATYFSAFFSNTNRIPTGEDISMSHCTNLDLKLTEWKLVYAVLRIIYFLLFSISDYGNFYRLYRLNFQPTYCTGTPTAPNLRRFNFK